jgi:hypothetical protein
MATESRTGKRPRPQVSICMDLALGQQRVVDAARMFFRQGLEALGHELHGRVESALRAGSYLGPDRRRAVLGAVSATCGGDFVDATGRVRKRNSVYSPRKLDSLMDVLDQIPTFVGVDIHTWGHRPWGSGLKSVEPSLYMSWFRNITKWASPLPDWVLLYADSSYELMLGSPERQAAVVEFLRAVTSLTNPACGEVSFQIPGETYTAPLEYLLQTKRNGRDSVAESRLTVRSYSWVTIISEEIGERLGGESALGDSGAFYRVEHLAGGGYLLQATELFEEYGHDEAYQVFRVLAPALPPGVPRAPRIYPPGYPLEDEPDFMIVQEDPASYLGGSGDR